MLPTVSSRPTIDIDVIVNIHGDKKAWIQHHAFICSLEEKGFRAADPPICRYKHNTLSNLLVDVGATKDTGIGPTNPWYAEGVRRRRVVDGLPIHVIAPECFLATKFVAWRDRGGQDIWESKDLEDIFTVFVGLPSLLNRIVTGGIEDEIVTFIRHEIRELLLAAGDQAPMMVEGMVDDIHRVGASALLKRLRLVGDTG